MDALWADTIDDWIEVRAETAVRPHARRGKRADGGPASLEGGSTCGLGDTAGEVEPRPAETTSTPPEPLPVEVIRSSKRRKSVSARIVDGRIVVRMPTWMSKAQEREYVASLVAKLERQRTAEVVDLDARAAALAHRYGLPRPRSIRFVSNQSSRWGSCTPSTGEIRISDRIAGFPTWVLDAVIVHELAHLVHLHHTAEFWEVANRYPKMERAYGFLIAKELTDDEVEP